MIITFCSTVPGQAGTTSNLAAVSLFLGIKRRYKVLLMQSSYRFHQLESSLFPENRHRQIAEEFTYYNRSGIDYLIDQAKSGVMDEKTVRQSTVPVYKDLISFLPGTQSLNGQIYEQEAVHYLPQLLSAMEDTCDLLFVDVGAARDELSKQIFERSDLIAVNFNQNSRNLERFFEKRQEHSEKLFYLIGGYDEASRYNRNNIRRLYRIQKNTLGVIPYNPEFQDAFCDGRVLKFLLNNQICRTFDKNYYFMRELEETSNLILKRVGMSD